MNKSIFKTILLLLVFYCNFLSAQTDTIKIFEGKIKVDAIKIHGALITKPFVILNELNFKPGDEITYNQLIYNQERIYSLGIFSKVKLYFINNTINIEVEESWYIYPIPYLELRDNDIKKLSLVFDLLVMNLRGRNETLRARFLFGYDPSFYLTYLIPSIDEKGDKFMSFETVYTKQNTKSRLIRLQNDGSNLKQDIIGFSVSAGKRFRLYHRTSVSIGYYYVESPKYVEGLNASKGRIDQYPYITLNYQYDSRDLIQFPKSGLYINSLLTYNGFGINDISYNVMSLDYREYRPVFSDLLSKWRLFYRTSFGKKVPLYDISYLGFEERVRGHYTEESEGFNSYLASLEFFYPIIKELYLNFDFIPVIPKKLLHYRIGLYTQIFGDAGLTLNSAKEFKYNKLKKGFGLGFTFLILPYNSLRTEIAFNEKLQSQLVLDLGISF